jgi:hypothetical protein
MVLLLNIYVKNLTNISILKAIAEIDDEKLIELMEKSEKNEKARKNDLSGDEDEDKIFN